MSKRAVRVYMVYESVHDMGPHDTLLYTDLYGAEMLRVILTGQRFESHMDGRLFVKDGLTDKVSVYFFGHADMELAQEAMRAHGH